VPPAGRLFDGHRPSGIRGPRPPGGPLLIGAAAVRAHTLFVYLIMRFVSAVGASCRKPMCSRWWRIPTIRKYDWMRRILDGRVELEAALTRASLTPPPEGFARYGLDRSGRGDE